MLDLKIIGCQTIIYFTSIIYNHFSYFNTHLDMPTITTNGNNLKVNIFTKLLILIFIYSIIQFIRVLRSNRLKYILSNMENMSVLRHF